MVNVRNVLAAVLILVGSITVFNWLFTGDEAKIKKRFYTLEKLVSKDSGEYQLKAAANAKKIGGMFAETCTVDIPSRSISKTYKRENIPANVMAARSRYSEILLEFHDIRVGFLDDGDAEISLTAYLRMVPDSGEPVREVQEFACRMKKFEKDWYLYRVEAVSVLER